MNGKNDKKRDFLNAADVVQSLFENSKSSLADGFSRYKLEQAWSQVVGETLFANTRPTAFRNGVLTISVSNSAWLHQLHYFRDEIISKVNTFMGRNWVIDLKFQVGK